MKFLVADDHPLVRRALRLTLDKVYSGASILEADTLAGVLDCLSQHPDIDLFLMDLVMPGSSGLDGLEKCREVAPHVPIAVVTADESADTAIHALELGAAGFLPKSMPEDVMRAALSLILAGGTYVPSLVAQRALRPAAAATPQADRGTLTFPRVVPQWGGDSLTPRQREVLELVIEGCSNKEIADRLSLAEATVKVHITAILRAYGVNSRAKAIGAARREREEAIAVSC